MEVRRAWSLLLVGAVLFVSAACSTRGGAPKPDSRTTTVAIRIGDAQPFISSARHLRSWTRFDGNVYSSVQAMDDRAALVQDVDVKTNQALSLTIRSLTKPGSGQRVPAHPGVQHSLVSATMNAGYVAWMEQPSSDLGISDWRLYVLDRATNRVRRLDRATPLRGGPPPSLPGYRGPVLVGRHLFWPKVVPTSMRQGYGTRLWSCDVTNCRPTVVAEGGALPASDGTSAYFVRARNFGAHLPPRVTQVMRFEPGAARATVVRTLRYGSHQALTEFSAGPSGYVWVDRTDTGHTFTTDAHFVANPGKGRNFSVNAGVYGNFVRPTVTSAVLVLPDGASGAAAPNSGYVVGLRSGRIYSVGKESGFYDMTASGRTLVWTEGASRNTPYQQMRTEIGDLEH